MYLIENLTSDPKQKQTLQLPDGTFITLEIAFVSLQQGWYIREITYGSFSLFNVRIVNSPNMLYQFKNKISFGLACFSSDYREPMLIDDLSSGYSKIYVLTASEVAQYASVLSGV